MLASPQQFKASVHYLELMKDYEREALLDKTSRETGFVGADIPETLEVDGETIRLQEYVMEARTEGIPEDLGEVVKELRRERTELHDSLREDELTYEEGMDIVETIAGIDRALTLLKAEPGDVDVEATRQERMDQQRWLEFLKKVTGRKKDGGRR